MSIGNRWSFSWNTRHWITRYQLTKRPGHLLHRCEFSVGYGPIDTRINNWNSWIVYIKIFFTTFTACFHDHTRSLNAIKMVQFGVSRCFCLLFFFFFLLQSYRIALAALFLCASLLRFRSHFCALFIHHNRNIIDSLLRLGQFIFIVVCAMLLFEVHLFFSFARCSQSFLSPR